MDGVYGTEKELSRPFAWKQSSKQPCKGAGRMVSVYCVSG